MSGELTFFQGLKALRRILEKHRGAPTALGELRHLLEDPDLRREFFAGLASPDWIALLQAEGYFDTAPEPTEAPGGGLQHPWWPEGKYLVRVAPEAPAEVVQVFEDVKTTNLSVVGNVLEAALAMPPASAAKLLPKIEDAAAAETLWIHFKDAGDLCVHLVEGGEVAAALELAVTLFAPRPDARENGIGRRDTYWYKDGLRKVVPTLVDVRPVETVTALCGWLDQVVDSKASTDRETGNDASYWWRPAIEEHEQNHDSDIASVLVGFVRQAAEAAVSRNGALLDEVLSVLSASPYVIFRRLKVHLVGVFAELAPEAARDLMMSRALFDDFRTKHEYAVLVGSRLGLLTEQEREQWFAWTDAGPDMSDYDERFRSSRGRDPTDDERRARHEYWRFEKLHCVRRYLDVHRKAFYERMLALHGEPELADLNIRVSSGWGGSESPLSVGDLSELSFGEAVERVAVWNQPDRSTMGPNLEGLAAVFGEYVGGNPQRFSGEALRLKGKPPIFVRTFLSQMTAAVKANQEVEVLAVLALCEWVLGRSVEEVTPPPDAAGLVDRSWQWTRDEVARFLVAVCQSEVDDRPRYALESLRDRIWRLIRRLSTDPDASYILSDSTEINPLTHDYLTEAINSPRGRAFEAALEYARWLANHLKGPGTAVLGGFDAMPEVRHLLDGTFSVTPRSAAAHAIIGSRLGLLYWIDKRWLALNAERLFFLTGIEEEPPVFEGWAAWNAFLVWVRPHIEFYRICEKQYAYAVQRSATVQSTDRSRQDPMARLGEHLMVLYGRGELPLDPDGGPVGEFLLKAPSRYRQHAMTFVGRVLEAESDLPVEFVKRYQALWERYWPTRGLEDARVEPDALPFGHWLASGRFDPAWGLSQLEAFVSVQPLPQPDRQVVKYLASVATVNAGSAVSILETMVSADREGWRIRMWLDSIRVVVESGLKAGGQARARAEAVIDVLGRRGFTELGTLLDS